MTDLIMKIIDKLKELVDENGPKYLEDNPYKTFIELIESGTSDRSTAGAVLCFLVSGLSQNISSDSDIAELSKQIQKECGFNKKMADRIATIFAQLYSQENEEEWKKKDMGGLKGFLKEEMTCSWEGYAYWDAGSGGVDCHYEAEIVLMPTEQIVIDGTLDRALKKNPFMTKEAVEEHYKAKLKKYLDCEFEDYCTCDDYYQPCVEDFMVDRDAVGAWCKENGFELKECDGDGYDDGYEPKLWNGGW